MYWPHFLGLFTLHNGTCVKEELECSGWDELPYGAEYYDGYEFNDEPWWNNERKYIDINYIYEPDPEYADYYEEIRNTPCSWTCKRWYKLENGECVLDTPCRYMIWERWKTMYEWVYKSKLCIDGWTADTSNAGVKWTLNNDNDRCAPSFVWECKKSWGGYRACSEDLSSVYIGMWSSIGYPYEWWFSSDGTLYDGRGYIPGGSGITITMGYIDKPSWNGGVTKEKVFKWGDVLNRNFDSVYGVLYYDVDPWLVNLDETSYYSNWKVVSPAMLDDPPFGYSPSAWKACPKTKSIKIL